MKKLLLLFTIIMLFSCKDSPVINYTETDIGKISETDTIVLQVPEPDTIPDFNNQITLQFLESDTTIYFSFPINPLFHYYEKGYKDALEDLVLLNLELQLKGERKSFGEMFEILYERNNINH